MDARSFKTLYDNLQNNIKEIEETIKKPELLEEPSSSGAVDRLKYLFYSLIKSLVDIGHSIILENEYRNPLNRADIFISLAERDIVLSSAVPGVKKAVLALPRINNCQSTEVVDIVSTSIVDIAKCLDSFVVYFDLKDRKI